jgi:hypothetical protein
MESLVLMPRRPTRDEEAILLRASRRRGAAAGVLDERQAELDRVVLELREAGVRVADMADVLDVPRARVYEAIRRAEAAES